MKYNQKTGEWTYDDGKLIAVGYAGHGEGKNNPALENISCLGPLPKGDYTIGEPYTSKHTGPFTLPLTPYPTNKMYDRSEFKVHGDDGHGTASLGCICINRQAREEIHSNKDKHLKVF